VHFCGADGGLKPRRGFGYARQPEHYPPGLTEQKRRDVRKHPNWLCTAANNLTIRNSVCLRQTSMSVKLLLWVAFLLPAFAQTEPPPSANPDQLDQNGAPENAGSLSADRSVNNPSPSPEVIKPKDYHDASGYLHPFRRMGGFILEDQKATWTSPFHTSKKDAKWWLIFGGATGAMIAGDKYISKNAPNNPTLKHLGDSVSYLGTPYTLMPITAGMYFGGTALGSDHFREAGLLSFEALADVTIVELTLKSIFDRQRPLEGHGDGEFEASSSPRYNSSFPSGHSIETFALASVVAHEYPHKRWVQVLAYCYAAGVIGARLAANQHFPGDVMAGGAIGWFMGDYVYGKRHNEALGEKKTAAQKIFARVRLGKE